jgi:hypothetical protein
MRRSDDVQDERYVTGAWMRRSDDVQDERYVTGVWMRGVTMFRMNWAGFMLLDNSSCAILITDILS